MAKDLDEVSHKIGSLESTLLGVEKSITKELAIMSRAIEVGTSNLLLIEKKADKANERIDHLEEPLRTAALHCNDWVETKKKAKWLIIGGSAAGTAGGFSFGKAISAVAAMMGGH